LQFLAIGTLCRAANNECDLPEQCTGDTGQCPADMYKKNGSPCGMDNSHSCYMGECPTLNDQCEQIWGYGELSTLSVRVGQNVEFFKR
jgi:hypothetical protein